MVRIFFSMFSTGFIVRFIVAFAIIAFLYSKNKNDTALKKGFIVLISLGAAVMILGVILFSVFFLAGGIGAMGEALSRFSYYNFY